MDDFTSDKITKVLQGDNPLCLLHVPSLGLYLYVSTEKILRRAKSRMDLGTHTPCRISLDCGEILRIDRDGTLTRSVFDDYRLFAHWRSPLWNMPYHYPWEEMEPEKKPVLKEIDGSLKSMQEAVGGTIQALYPFEEPVALICNDEGKLLGLPLNRALRDEEDRIYDIIRDIFPVRGSTRQ